MDESALAIRAAELQRLTSDAERFIREGRTFIRGLVEANVSFRRDIEFRRKALEEMRAEVRRIAAVEFSKQRR